jgi:hypothetical protein
VQSYLIIGGNSVAGQGSVQAIRNFESNAIVHATTSTAKQADDSSGIAEADKTFSYDPPPYTDEHIRLLQYPPADQAQDILHRRNVRYVVTDGGDNASAYFTRLGLREVQRDGDMRVFER